MDLKLSFNEQELKDQLHQRMKDAASSTMNAQLSRFFHSGNQVYGPGIGFTEIETKIVNLWESPEFQTKIDKFMQENWEQIMREAMVKAATHKANGFVFNRSKGWTQSPDSSDKP